MAKADKGRVEGGSSRGRAKLNEHFPGYGGPNAGIQGFLSRPRPYDEDLGPVVAAHIGNNAGLIADAARLYIPDGALVLDTTLGFGAFWGAVDTTRFFLCGSDIRVYTDEQSVKLTNLGVRTIFDNNYRDLGMRDEFWDVTIFDPPYKSGGGGDHEPTSGRYGLDTIQSDTPSKHGNFAVISDDYHVGMGECARVTVPGGLVWVKCQDFVESGKQHWMHMLVAEYAEDWGLARKDLFVLTSTKAPRMRHKSQHHARKNVSYLWVFQKS